MIHRLVICAAIFAVFIGVAYSKLSTASTIHYDTTATARAAAATTQLMSSTSPAQAFKANQSMASHTPITKTNESPLRLEALFDTPAEFQETNTQIAEVDSTVFTVPFYSQFADITPAAWRKVGCGVASLAMLIDFYKPAVSVDTLLQEGIDSDAYLTDAGWTHAGLINLSKKYGLDGTTQSYAALTMDGAFAELKKALEKGPVMASVHYTFTPTNPIPHLVVITGVDDSLVYYNDPAENAGGGSLSIAKFQSSWKKRFIQIYPAT